MIRISLLCLLVLVLWGLHIEKKHKGDVDNPMALPPKSVAEVFPVQEKIERVTVNVMALTRQQESHEMLCITINNQSLYTLTEIECQIYNLTRDTRDIFTIRPVAGEWVARNGFRKYVAKPKGIQNWSGNFGSRLNLQDTVEIKILAVYGFRA